jgi:hypothetical protein
MRYRRFARPLLGLALLTAASAGCSALAGARPVAVLVRDAETKAPIPAAEVRFSGLGPRSPLTPSDSSVKAEGDGVARLPGAPCGDNGVEVGATAAGYLPGNLDLTAGAVEKLKPAGWFEAADQRPADFVVEMYSGPEFTVELVVPTGYRGLVRVEVQVQDDATPPPGQRCFRYDVPPSGTVEVVGPPPLRRVSPPGYHARYADGTPLAPEMDAARVGFRWLKQEGRAMVFVVGTKDEFDGYCKGLAQDAPAPKGPSPDGGRGGGRGGRRNRGGQSASP